MKRSPMRNSLSPFRSLVRPAIRWSTRDSASGSSPSPRQRSRSVHPEQATRVRLSSTSTGPPCRIPAARDGAPADGVGAMPISPSGLVLPVMPRDVDVGEHPFGNPLLELPELGAFVQERDGAGLHAGTPVLRVRVV